MASNERGMQTKADINRAGWEEADFPIVCETCLGENPYVRMTRRPFGQACKICERPFTVFRWKAGSGRFKATQICQTCAKLKNVCQTCVLDLTYGLPVEVRDSFLAEHERTRVPVSTVMRDFVAQEMDAQQAGALVVPGQGLGGAGGAISASAHEGLLRLARREPKYKRNLAHICSFFARGECTRGASCPYRHEMPTDKEHPFAKQNIKDRFYGVDDPVAAAMLKRAGLRGGGDGDGGGGEARLGEPDSPDAKKLWIGRVTESVTEGDLREAVAKHDGVTNIFISRRSSCAFIEFATHAQARAAGTALVGNFKVNGADLVVSWAKSRDGGGAASGATAGASAVGAPGGRASAGRRAPAAPTAGVGGVGGLAAYGSDSDDDAAETAAAKAPTTSAEGAGAGAGAGGAASGAAPRAPAPPAGASAPRGPFSAAPAAPPAGIDYAALIPPPPGAAVSVGRGRGGGRVGPVRTHGPGGTNRLQMARSTPYPSMDPRAMGSRVKPT
eukprot:CAMPEP_0203817136 /NCGR_PEP_ID=MMETSP0115-20131106/18336_1 /ASSEMBLY_ACC=CAM_ASM_000227 /TAXON_ID=33651 /ORGANISM="Bicosoecid sp, Strain ms1" /LENGTH=500 /DNA_ID=CAMNT_0050726053 /DNA_START=249 /DNA_END=1751 /DNA_ORIENTATION=+